MPAVGLRGLCEEIRPGWARPVPGAPWLSPPEPLSPTGGDLGDGGERGRKTVPGAGRGRGVRSKGGRVRWGKEARESNFSLFLSIET